MSYLGHEPDKVKKRIKYLGIPICLEWLKGDLRAYSDGYRKLMQCDYGFIPGVSSSYDGDDIDVFLGEDGSSTVYVCRQLKRNLQDTDEIKFMLGFKDKGTASRMFAAHVATGRYGGVIAEVPILTFKEIIDLARCAYTNED